MFLGILLVGIGIVALSVQFGILPSGVASLVWPMLAIFVGIWLLVGKRHGASCTCWGCDAFGAKKRNNK